MKLIFLSPKEKFNTIFLKNWFSGKKSYLDFQKLQFLPDLRYYRQFFEEDKFWLRFGPENLRENLNKYSLKLILETMMAGNLVGLFFRATSNRKQDL